MKTTIVKSDIVDRLKTSEKALGTIKQGILGCMHIQAMEGRLRLSTTTGDVYVDTYVEAETEEGGTALVDGRTFISAIRKSNEVIKLEVNKSLFLTSGRSRYKLGVLDDSFPEFPETGDHMFSVHSDVLNKATRETSYVVDESDDGWKGGVYFTDGRLVATDSSRLAITEIDIECEGLLLPKKALDLMHTLEGELSLSYNGEMVTVQSDKAHVASRIIDVPYVNYESIVPSSNPIHVEVSRTELLAALGRSTVVDDVGAVTLASTGGMLEVSTPHGIHEFHEAVPVQHSGDGSSTYGSRIIMDFLRSVGDDTVIFEFNEDMKAAMFKADGVQYVLMPMRV